MTRIFIATIAAATVAAGMIAASASAFAEHYDVNCGTIIEGKGVSSRVEGSDDWNHYRGKIPPGLAKRRAIVEWESIVAQSCQGYSAKWWRSKAKNVECDNGAGHEYCSATAVPGRKLFGWLIPE